MKMSSRLTRAGACFLVFGTVASLVPNSGMMSAGACGGSDSGSRAGQDAAWFAGGLGATYLILAATKKKHHHDDTQTGSVPTSTVQPASWNDVHSFVYTPAKSL